MEGETPREDEGLPQEPVPEPLSPQEAEDKISPTPEVAEAFDYEVEKAKIEARCQERLKKAQDMIKEIFAQGQDESGINAYERTRDGAMQKGNALGDKAQFTRAEELAKALAGEQYEIEKEKTDAMNALEQQRHEYRKTEIGKI